MMAPTPATAPMTMPSMVHFLRYEAEDTQRAARAERDRILSARPGKRCRVLRLEVPPGAPVLFGNLAGGLGQLRQRGGNRALGLWWNRRQEFRNLLAPAGRNGVNEIPSSFGQPNANLPTVMTITPTSYQSLPDQSFAQS